MKDNQQELFNIRQAAQFLGVSVSTIRRWGQKNQLKGIKVGSRGDWKFSKDDLLQMIQKKAPEERLATKQLPNIYFPQLINASPDPTLITDADVRICYVNPAWERLTGYTLDEVRGKNPKILSSGKTPGKEYQKLWQALKKGETYITEAIIDRRKDGTEYQIHSTFFPINNDYGTVFYAQVQHDITARKRREEEMLRESEERFRALVAATSDVVYRMSPDWNEMRQLEGRGFLSDTGNPIRNWLKKYIHPKDQKRVLEVINEAIRTKSIFELEHQVLQVDGTLGWTFSRAIPILDEKGEIIEWFGAASDVTELKQAEESLKGNEERFRLLVENSADAIALVDKTGKFMYVSPPTEKVLGYKSHELIGRHTTFLFPKEHHAEVQHFFAPVMEKTGAKVSVEHKIVHKDGSIRWIESRVTNLLDKPNVHALVSNFRDITERKEIEERQQFLEQANDILGSSIDYETTLKNLGKLIIPYLADYCRIVVLDSNKKIREITINHANPRKIPLVKKLYESYKDDSENNAGVGQIIQTGKAELIPQLTPEVLKNTKQQVLDIIDELHLQSYMGVPMKIGNKIIGVITFSSARKEKIYTNEDLRVARELARRAAFAVENARLYAGTKRALMLRDDFISVASHELKTPVTSLKMYTHTFQRKLGKQGGENGNEKYFEKINDQTNKLTSLINDLLDVSKIQHGRLEFAMEEFDLNGIIHDAIEAIQETTNTHKIIFKGSAKKKTYGDRNRLYQVLANLLTNAIKYSHGASRIIIDVMSKKDASIVSVRDFGIGIEEEDQKKIFQQFYRVSSGEEKTFPGLGMGLYIAYEIVKRHGGDIIVESEKGKGSIFSFTLPYTFEEQNRTEHSIFI